MANEFVAKNGLISQNNSTVSGSLTVTQGITGSFTGSLTGTATTASYVTGSVFTSTNPALSASFATSASQAVTSSFALRITPGGSNQQVQFNNNGVLAGAADFKYIAASGSVALGTAANAYGFNSFARGNIATANAISSHAEGQSVTANGAYSHAEGQQTTTDGIASHAEGIGTQATGNYSHAEGGATDANGEFSHAEGNSSQANGVGSHAEGGGTIARGTYSHTEGAYTQTSTSASFAHAEGFFTEANGYGSHAEGGRDYIVDTTIAIDTTTLTDFGYEEGSGFTIISSTSSSIVVSGDYSANSQPFTCSLGFSVTDGINSIQLNFGYYSVPIISSISYDNGLDETTFTFSPPLESIYYEVTNQNTIASGKFSHAEGVGTQAQGTGSHAEGRNTIAAGDYQHVQGQYNIQSSDVGAFIIGNGTDVNNRRNLVFASGSEVQITGSLNTTGSVFFTLTEQSQNNVVLIDTASGQLHYTASSAIGGGSGAGFPYSGNAVITGSLLVSGSGLTVTGSVNISGSLNATSSWAVSASQAITASYILASGVAGLSLTQIASGSLTASVTPTQFSVVSGSMTEFLVTGTGVTLGGTVTDTHRVTGSLNINGAVAATSFTGNGAGLTNVTSTATVPTGKLVAIATGYSNLF